MNYQNGKLRSRVLALLSLILFCAAVEAKDSSVIRLALQGSGADPDAAGFVTSLLTPRKSSLAVNLSRLAPGQTFALRVGGVEQATFTTSSKGRARLAFSTPTARRGLPLDFDPRGQLLEILDGATVILSAVISGEGEPAGSSVSENTDLLPLAGGGKASLSYSVRRDGQRRFSVALKGVTGTNWVLYVNGRPQGALKVRGRSGRTVYDDNPSGSEYELNFDPRGQVIDIAQSTNLLFSGRCEARARNLNFATPSLRSAFIPTTGLDADGTARARYRVDKDARRKFSVELEDVPVGAYDLLADGVLQGTINVVNVPGGTEGEIEFSSREDDGDELPLSFDPTATTTFLVQQGTAVYFQGALTSSVPGGFTNDSPQELRESLTSTGLDGDASGEAKFEIDGDGRRKFSVEIEDVAVGSYQLWVGGIQKGTIHVKSVLGKVEGEIEFSTHDDDDDEMPLTFDPRGQLLEVKSGAGVLFSHLFGVGGTNETSAVPAHTELPLFSTGADDDASAKMEFKRDDRGRRHFEVEIEDVAVGDYNLSVGGVNRGVITVVAVPNGTRGQMEFEDDPEAGELLLTFDPLGGVVSLDRNGVTYFERILPVN